jgi:hypothetical protein
MVEVFGLDVEHDAVLGMVLHDGAVAFIALGDEEFTARIPTCVGAENRNLRADIMRRVRPGGAEDMSGHGRDRRLAVHSADKDAFFPGHEAGERFRATDQRFSRGARGIESGIPGADSRGVDDDLGIVRIGGTVWRAEIEPEGLQAPHLRGVDFVRSADAVAKRQEESGDAAHARTSHTDKMDATR